MRSRISQSEADRIRREYEQWDRYGPDAETAEELARRLGISKATLYRLRDRHWRVGPVSRNNGHVPAAAPAGAAAADIDVPAGGNPADLAAAVRWLSGELIAAQVRIAELERELGRSK